MATIAKRSVPRVAKIHKPQVDDRCVTDALYGLYALPSLLVAYKMGLFELLENGGLTSKEIAAKLNLAVRPTDALLACSASLGFVYRANGTFGGHPTGSEATFGAAAGVRALEGRLVVGPEIWASTVLADGFEYQGRQYRSLSAIACEITGTRWNGLAFFGLTGKSKSNGGRRHGAH